MNTKNTELENSITKLENILKDYKLYKIIILPRFKKWVKGVEGVPLYPIVKYIEAKSFMEAVGKGMYEVGAYDQQFEEFTHELVSVRRRYN